jgi:hypothetical protein
VLFYVQVMKERSINCINHCYQTHNHLQANYTHNFTITITKITIYVNLNLNFNTQYCSLFRAAPISIHCHDDTVINKILFFLLLWILHFLCGGNSNCTESRTKYNTPLHMYWPSNRQQLCEWNECNLQISLWNSVLSSMGPNNNISFYTVFSCVHCVVQ